MIAVMQERVTLADGTIDRPMLTRPSRRPVGEEGFWDNGEWVRVERHSGLFHFATGEKVPLSGLRNVWHDQELRKLAKISDEHGLRMATMQGQYSIVTGKVTTAALTTGSAKSMILINPATDGFSVTEWWPSYGAVASQTDIAFEVYRVNSLGSPAGTSATVNKDNPGTASATATGLTALSAEPTSVFTLREIYLPVNQGFLVFPWPLGREPYAAAAGSRFGFRVVNDEGGTMTAVDTRNTAIFVEE